jgi:hypothetical protein
VHAVEATRATCEWVRNCFFFNFRYGLSVV